MMSSLCSLNSDPPITNVESSGTSTSSIKATARMATWRPLAKIAFVFNYVVNEHPKGDRHYPSLKSTSTNSLVSKKDCCSGCNTDSPRLVQLAECREAIRASTRVEAISCSPSLTPQGKRFSSTYTQQSSHDNDDNTILQILRGPATSGGGFYACPWVEKWNRRG